MGRHNAPVAVSTGRKITTAAAAVGAMVGAGQLLASGTASAQGDTGALPPELQGLLPEGFTLPEGVQLPPLPDFQLPTDIVPPAWSQPNGALGGAIASTYQPVNGVLTSSFGSRWGAHHGGADIAAPIGTIIRSAASGEVINAGPASGYGQWVQIRHDDGSVATYGHIESYSVRQGQFVQAGQQIATVGNRGQSTGPHLHFEVWDPSGSKLDPIGWLKGRGVSPDWSVSA